MREVTRSALVPYTAEQMFALVADIERYPEFVPWLVAAEKVDSGPNQVTGRLEMHRAGMREKFTTRNVLNPPKEITLTLVDGPFRVLEGRWTFEPLGEQGNERGVRIGLTIRFEFANAMLGMLLSRTFEKNCGELVDAFVARARSLYGRARMSF
jgi:ribosome-associated toxin RatA of RatAB toxin-antitoxin module